MLGNAGSGFGWDDVNKCVTCDTDVWNDWVKGHKDVVGLRKFFPHFDELAIIFGKDRVTEDGAEASTDAVENIEVEEAIAKASSEAYNAMNVGNDDDFLFNEVNLENFEDLVFFSNIGNTKSSTSATRRPTMQSEKEEISKLATCFQHLADNAKRKMQLYDVIAAIQGLTDEDALKAGAIISTDVDKTNYFFSISDRMKKLYVQGLLSGSI
ncbi:hypothetical protein DITRI_Ditri18aG0051500 [Diplodiscus trichospermus]